MKLIKPSYEILDQKPGLEGIYKAIEVAGRTCYKSLDKITEDSAEGFVDRMIKSQHYAMLEHGTVYLTVPYNSIIEYANSQNPYYRDILCNPWIKYVIDYENDVVYISSNYRWIIENNLENWLQYLCEPTEFHEKRVTVRFTTSNGIMREFTRHRSHSFAVESTRYCNYSKDKFNNEITFIEPFWYDRQSPALREDLLISGLREAEKHYLALIEAGCKPQEAREVLPLATKCDMVMTGFMSDWSHFFDLRAKGTTGSPHPDAKALAEPLMHEFINRNYLNCHTND